MFNEFLLSTWQTFYMVIVSCAIAVVAGLPLGVFLLITRKKHIFSHLVINKALSAVANAVRSIPFIILLIAVTPLTRLITGTSIGTTAAIVPLSIAAIPFFARLIESNLAEVSYGLIEAGLSMGASTTQIILKILIPEALGGIINSITITFISLIGYSAMAGAIGGGGLGDLAIRYGYQRFDITVMLATIVILIIMVQAAQMLGDKCAKKVSHL